MADLNRIMDDAVDILATLRAARALADEADQGGDLSRVIGRAIEDLDALHNELDEHALERHVKEDRDHA